MPAPQKPTGRMSPSRAPGSPPPQRQQQQTAGRQQPCQQPGQQPGQQPAGRAAPGQEQPGQEQPGRQLAHADHPQTAALGLGGLWGPILAQIIRAALDALGQELGLGKQEVRDGLAAALQSAGHGDQEGDQGGDQGGDQDETDEPQF